MKKTILALLMLAIAISAFAEPVSGQTTPPSVYLEGTIKAGDLPDPPNTDGGDEVGDNDGMTIYATIVENPSATVTGSWSDASKKLSSWSTTDGRKSVDIYGTINVPTGGTVSQQDENATIKSLAIAYGAIGNVGETNNPQVTIEVSTNGWYPKNDSENRETGLTLQLASYDGTGTVFKGETSDDNAAQTTAETPIATSTIVFSKNAEGATNKNVDNVGYTMVTWGLMTENEVPQAGDYVADITLTITEGAGSQASGTV